MTKLEIFNIALGEHGKHITQTDIDNNIWEVTLCETYYRGAVLNVLGECDWTFYKTRIIFEKDYDFPEGKWAHGYLLPQGILRVVPLSTFPYEVLGGKFLTNEELPEIYAIMDNFDCETARDEICYLVGYNLAFLLCQKLSPANQNILSSILQNYQMMLEPLKMAQSNSYVRSVEEGGAIPDTQIRNIRAERFNASPTYPNINDRELWR